VNAADEAYFAAAQGRPSSRSAELPAQVRAFIGLLVVVALAKQRQLRAPEQAARPPVSPRPPTRPPVAQDLPASQMTLAVQKIAAQSSAASDAALRRAALQPVTTVLDPIVKNVGTIAKGALGAAGLAAGVATLQGGVAAGFSAGASSLAASASAASSAISSAASGLAAAAPAAVPLAAAGVIASIVAPAIASGQFFSGSIDPYFDATTAAAMKRAAAQAALIRQDLLDSGNKFARRGQTSFALGG
jgi:hypothetical protein